MVGISDTSLWLGFGALVVAAGLGLLAALEDVAASSPGRPKGGAATGRSDGAATGRSDRTDVRSRESIPRSPESAPGCREVVDSIAAAKGVLAGFDAELRDSTAMTDAEETTLGDKIERSLRRDPALGPKLDLAEDVERYSPYVTRLLDELAHVQGRPGLRYRAHLLRDSDFNAYALPGGTIVIHTGLFEGPDALESEAEFMAVLGHEVAHIEKRHCIGKFQLARRAFGEDADDLAPLLRYLEMPLSAEREHEADTRGLELSAMLGYDPMAPSELWRRMGTRTSAHRRPPGAVARAIVSLLQSHPPAPTRCWRTLNEGIDFVGRSGLDEFYVGRRNFAARIPRFVQAF